MEALIGFMEIMVSVFAGWGCLRCAARRRPDITPDRTPGGDRRGCLAWGAGQTLWTLAEVVLGHGVPLTGWPDLFFLATYPLALTASAGC